MGSKGSEGHIGEVIPLPGGNSVEAMQPPHKGPRRPQITTMFAGVGTRTLGCSEAWHKMSLVIYHSPLTAASTQSCKFWGDRVGTQSQSLGLCSDMVA